ncbi:hypothetical protein WN71_032435 [Streptomyces mangrovisoli]|uniref:Uncharacterized protein n=1 Tax=Streptomyces mangrovisoli TaxID=1428628 RepID=A0A1J4NMW1_9ACTN|nr:hypothetical protein WN71_032435 [Streptomyces mangrovisoli]
MLLPAAEWGSSAQFPAPLRSLVAAACPVMSSAGRWGPFAQFPAPLWGAAARGPERGAGNCASKPHRPADDISTPTPHRGAGNCANGPHRAAGDGAGKAGGTGAGE